MATYVGRIGALAVALGVGVAVTGSPAVAWAEPTAPSPSSDSAAPSDTQDTASTDPPVDADGESSSTASQASNTVSDDSTVSGSSTQETTTLPGGVTISSSGGARTSDAMPGAQEPVSSSPPLATPLHGGSAVVTPQKQGNDDPPAGDTPTLKVAPASADGGAAATPPAEDSGAESTVPTVAAPSALRAAPSLMSTSSSRTSLTASDATTLAPAPDPIASLIAIPGQVITAVIGTLLSPFLAPAGTPSQPPLLWAVLGWVRREIQTTFFNRRPVLAAPTDVVQLDRVVTGVTVGTDPDGDEVVYTVAPTSAAGGTVTVDDQGGFLYVAPESWNGATELTDSFVVTVSDATDGFHVHGLAGLFFGGGHTTTRTVEVTLAPTDVEPIATAAGSITVPTSGAGWARGVDGTLAAYYRTGSGTTADPYRTTITVLRQGRTPVSSTADGSVTGGVTVLADGTTAVTTRTGAGTLGDPSNVVFTVMRPGVATETLTTAGTPGLAYPNVGQTAVAGLTYIAVDGVLRMGAVRVARVGEPPIVITFDGRPQFFAPRVGADGTVVFTSTLLADDGSTISNTVNVLPAGSRALQQYTFAADGPEQLAGDPTVGGNGTVVFATMSGSGTDGDPVETTVTILRPNQNPLVRTTVGAFSAAEVGSDGTVAYATETGSGAATETTITVVRPGQSAVASTTSGRLHSTQIGDDGTVAAQTYTGVGSPADPYRLTVTVLRPSADPIMTTATAGYLFLPQIGADGTVVVDALTGPSGGWHHEFIVLRPGRDPASIVTDMPGSTAVVGSDGTVAVRSTSYAGPSPVTEIVVLRGGQSTASSYTAAGSGLFNPAIGADGTVVVTSTDGPAAVVTVIRPGQSAATYTGTGVLGTEPFIGSDGVIYQPLETDGRTNTDVIVIEPSGESKVLSLTGRLLDFTVHDIDGASVLVATTSPADSTTTYTSYEITLAPTTV